MEDSTKLALAVVAAALILVVGYVGYSEFCRQRDIGQAQTALASLQHVRSEVPAGQRLIWQTQQLDPRTVADAAELQQQRHRLALNERCVGGVVIRVNGSVYTQVGSLGNPVRCSGSYVYR